MKKYLRLLITLATIISLGACQSQNKNNVEIDPLSELTSLENISNKFQVENDWHLYVLDKDITSKAPVVLVSEEATTWKCVPLLSVLRLLDVSIVPQNDDIIVLKYNNKTLYLNAKEKVISDSKNEGNALETATGGKIYYEFINYEVVCSSPAFLGVCYELGLRVNFVVNDNYKTIKINQI